MDDFYAQNTLPDDGSFYNPILPDGIPILRYAPMAMAIIFLQHPRSPISRCSLFHSRDLVNWKQIGRNVLTRESQLVNMNGQHVSGGIFAPALSYNPANKTYYMITTNVGAGNFFVKTQDPFGEWSDPIYVPEVQGIDPSFFFDKDGKGYIVNNDDAPDGKPEYSGHRTVRIVEFDPATDKCVGERKIIVNKGWRPQDKPIWCEGPHIYNIDGTYYLMTAEGGTGDWHSEVIYRGKVAFRSVEPWQENPILTQRTLDNSRPEPITSVPDMPISYKQREGDWWAVFLACRPLDGRFENLGRETFMMPVKWTDDGWPYMTRGEEVVPMVLNRPGVKREENVTFGNFTDVDDFDADTLGLQWMTLRTPAADLYSLTSNPVT